MKKYLKTALAACVAVCLIACLGLFATACTDTSKYEITVVSATDSTPVEGIRINFCHGTTVCIPQQPTDANGKVTVDLTAEGLKGEHEFHIAILGTGYEFVTEGYEHDESGILLDTQKDGYSITVKVKAVA